LSGVTVPLTLLPGQGANYTALFAPTLVGNASGQISFLSNATNSPTLISLAGVGVAPPLAQLNANPTSIAFGNVNVGSTSSISGTLTASGAPVTISVGTVTGTGFSLIGFGPLPLTVNVGQSTAFTAVFSPTSATAVTGSITFLSTASNSPAVVSLSGTGVPVSTGTPCGQLGDGLIHLPPNYNSFSPPARGQSYVDPQYGCTVVRLTQGISQFGVPAHHYYSTITPFNADDSRIMLYLDNGSPAIVDLTGNVVVPAGNIPGSNTNNHPWDPSNPAVFYYTNINQFIKGTISGNTVTGTALRTFTGYSTCVIPDQEDVTDDGTKIWLVCTPSGGSASQNVAVLYNLATDVIVSQSLVVGAQEGGWHKIQIFPSGKMLLTGGSLCTQCIYNTDGTLYWNPPFAYSGHADVGTDLQGREVMISTASGVDSLNACGTEKWSSLTAVDINAKTPVGCVIGKPPSPGIPSWHISYRDSANSSTGKWVLTSMFDQGTCPGDYSCFTSRLAANWTSLWSAYSEELVLAKIDGSQVYRLGYTWSRSAENYWAQPHAAISRTGKYMVFDSNFNISNTGFSQYSDVYLVKIQ